jgi:hypothetical protein
MDHALGVRRLSRPRDLFSDLDSVLESQLGAHLIERPTFDELHGDIGTAVDFTDVVHATHVIVLDLTLCASFTLKPLHLLRVVGIQKFEGNRPSEAAVDRTVDPAHGALAEKTLDREAIPFRCRVFEHQLVRIVAPYFCAVRSMMGRSFGVGIGCVGAVLRHLKSSVARTAQRADRIAVFTTS